MRKLTVIFALTLGLSLLFFSPVLAVGPPNFHFDFNGDDVYETSWDLSVGEKVSVEVFVGEWDQAYSGEDIFGVSAFFYYDTAKIKLNASDIIANDSNHGGPFDPTFTDISEIETGKYELDVANFGCVPVEKDRILIGTIELEAIAPGEAEIEIKTDSPNGTVSSGGVNCTGADTGDAGNGFAKIVISGSSVTTSQNPTPTTTTTSSGSSGTTSIPDTTTSLPVTSTTSTTGGGISSTTTTIEVPPPSSTTSTKPDRCPLIEIVGDNNNSGLDVIRQFRDKRLAKSANGMALICLYYLHGEEVTDILSSNPSLSARVKEIIMETAPALKSGMKQGGKVIINKKQYMNIIEVMKDIMKESSSGLRSSMSFIMKQLDSDEFLGKAGVKVEGN